MTRTEKPIRQFFAPVRQHGLSINHRAEPTLLLLVKRAINPLSAIMTATVNRILPFTDLQTGNGGLIVQVPESLPPLSEHLRTNPYRPTIRVTVRPTLLSGENQPASGLF